MGWRVWDDLAGNSRQGLRVQGRRKELGRWWRWTVLRMAISAQTPIALSARCFSDSCQLWAILILAVPPLPYWAFVSMMANVLFCPPSTLWNNLKLAQALLQPEVLAAASDTFSLFIHFIQRPWCWDIIFQRTAFVILQVLEGACSSARIKFLCCIHGGRLKRLWVLGSYRSRLESWFCHLMTLDKLPNLSESHFLIWKISLF